MSHSQEIDNALNAHGAWKQRLLSAIEAGSSEFQVPAVKVDNGCAFGKWFYALPMDMRSSEHGVKVQKLHAAFHQEAARILELAVNKKKAEATAAIGLGSQYSNTSGQLAMALNSWKRALGG